MTRHYRNRRGAGSSTRRAAKWAGNHCWCRGYLLASNNAHVPASSPSARSPLRSRPSPAACSAAASRSRRTPHRKLPDVHGRAVRDRGALRRQGRVRPAGLRRDSGMLQTLDPHSSFMDPRQYAQLRERQEGRYYGLGITIQVVDGDITVQAHVRRVAGLQEGHSPRRHHREDRRRGREGLDERSGRAQAARPEGHDRRGLDQAARATTG